MKPPRPGSPLHVTFPRLGRGRPHSLLLVLGLALGATRLAGAGEAPADPGGTLVHPRYYHSATRLADGRVMLAGGIADSTFTVTAACEIYNPATNTWTATGNLNTGRYQHQSVLLPEGRVLAMGGQVFGANTVNSVEIYNPPTGTWSAGMNMITARTAFDAVLLPNGKVLVAGGAVPFGLDTANCELYDPATGTWSATGSLLQPRNSLHATLLADGRVLVAGGNSQTAGLIAQSELYDPATGTWSGSGSLTVPRSLNAQVRLADGRVLVAGGVKKFTRNTPKITASCEVFDPATRVWSSTGSLNTPRIIFSANLLNSGRVFAAGGTDGTSLAYDSIEEFAAFSGQWRTLATTLDSPRRYHSTVTLLDGSLIVAGGFDSNSPTLIPTAELFVRPR